MYATIPGMIQDEVVILGNHRDAWTYGAGDPNSGSSSVDEILRAFGTLLEKGWKPLRPILIASWDGKLNLPFLTKHRPSYFNESSR